MRTTRLGFSPTDHIPEAIRDGLVRRLAEAGGLALMLAVFAFNLLGDSLRDIVDPRSRT